MFTSKLYLGSHRHEGRSAPPGGAESLACVPDYSQIELTRAEGLEFGQGGTWTQVETYP